MDGALALLHMDVRSARPGGRLSIGIAAGNPKGGSFVKTLLLTFSVFKSKASCRRLASMPFFDGYSMSLRVTFGRAQK